LYDGNRPDLIILDLRMPEMNGDEFLIYLKKNGLYKDIPVVVLSGEESSDIRIKMLELGAEDFILKPFNPMELKIRIKKVLK
jgi:DNA-binding response OmpR family regulator